MQATIPMHAESIGMVTLIKPKRNNRRGRNGTISNSGLQAASLAAPARDGRCALHLPWGCRNLLPIRDGVLVPTDESQATIL